MGLALAGLPQVLKGYGETQKRGHENYERIWNECVAPVLDAPLQMQRETEALRAAAGQAGDNDLEALMGAVATAWPPSTRCF